MCCDERSSPRPTASPCSFPRRRLVRVGHRALRTVACVENAYVEKQRRTFKREARHSSSPREAEVDGVGKVTYARPAALPAEKFDDVIYFGSDAAVVEKLFANVGTSGLFVIVQAGRNSPSGRDGGWPRSLRWYPYRRHNGQQRGGCAGGDPCHSGNPAERQDQHHRRAGPMGTMHVIRDLCQGVPGVTIYAGDLRDERLTALRKASEPLRRKTCSR